MLIIRATYLVGEAANSTIPVSPYGSRSFREWILFLFLDVRRGMLGLGSVK